MEFVATVSRPFRGVSADDRITQRRVVLLNAALAEVGEVGVAQLRMNTVCKRARLTQRYFYEHFRNREDLLVALFDSVLDEVIAETIAAVAASGPDLFDRASAALAVFYDAIISDPHKARLYAESAGVATLYDRKRSAVRRYVDLVAKQITEFLGEMNQRTKSRLTMATLVLVGGQADAAVELAAGHVAISRDDYVELHSRMLIDAIAAAQNGP
ncbi:transcriptional regulator [Mycobacteroides abscessus subsp. abscessus]|nr:transcriptional regulator [Mycobacteroides abscessus subsp. abscessus]SHS74886.1 transcriptional regulator [Mycobacteroides abscessus subsp. abscessus]SHT26697.1 transcriptional regulator [Mycobacteroides abscessus subsp. abscessus]SLK84666.1 transcriptional regulator [Mycobacteroides abscessus subsp. abscessus]